MGASRQRSAFFTSAGGMAIPSAPPVCADSAASSGAATASSEEMPASAGLRRSRSMTTRLICRFDGSAAARDCAARVSWRRGESGAPCARAKDASALRMRPTSRPVSERGSRAHCAR
jgi:hypothetical protein